jgi:geranylgeranyl reductase family protein
VVSERVDVLVVGAGPAGSTAARVAAELGARVLLVERRSRIGLPVQCAEYVPAQIVQYAPLPRRCIAQRIKTMCTYLPDGTTVETPAAGYVVDRALFDKALAIAAHRAGAQVWTMARAIERTDRGVLIRRGVQVVEVEADVIVGADGPSSTVGRWVGQKNAAYGDARQVEVVLPSPRPSPEIYFHPLYRGGYGWLFPKGGTANVGVGVSREVGGDLRAALEHLLDRLEIGRDAIVGRTGGLLPSGGEVGQLRTGNVLLVGDAAGHTHPVTGAGVAAAAIGGTLAGQAAARALDPQQTEGSSFQAALDGYDKEWASFMRGPLRHALEKRRYLDEHWNDDAGQLSALLRETWIAFKAYGRRVGEKDRPYESLTAH